MISFRELGTWGGLGNQLFEIATTAALALRHKDRYVFPSWLYAPSFPNLKDCYCEAAVIKPDRVYSEPTYHYTPIPYEPNMDLRGYFQSYRYFEDFREEILRLLTPGVTVKPLLGYASLHVRRGDYVGNTECYLHLGPEYYERAIDRLKGVEKFLVFSDDIAWCRKTFTGDLYEFSEGRTDVEDLAWMASCDHNIIAGSSFSWWGAYLNRYPGKRVIAPRYWLGPKLPHDTKDWAPPDWILV